MTALTHLQRLEAHQGIHILREVVAAVQRPVMLCSIGKDRSVQPHRVNTNHENVGRATTSGRPQEWKGY